MFIYDMTLMTRTTRTRIQTLSLLCLSNLLSICLSSSLSLSLRGGQLDDCLVLRDSMLFHWEDQWTGPLKVTLLVCYIFSVM